MREALAGLTIRGRAFLAAGITAVVCAIILDQLALVRVGVLLIALPLVTAFVVGRGRYRLSLIRRIEPHSAEVGQPARVELTMTNEGWIPTGTLLLEETLPYALGHRPRFVVDRIGHGWRRRVAYQIRSDVRGRFDIGPMTVRVADPFGLVELGRAFQTTTSFTVTPRTVALSPINLSGTATASGDSRPRSFVGGSAEDVTVREYRRGDELRRVHWLSSARVGQLMVRREEQPWEARAVVLLDDRLRVHRGQGLASSFEAAVSVAASVVVHLEQAGYAVRLVTSTGAGPEDTDNAGAELERLALITPTQRQLLDVGWCGEQARGGVVVAVLGSMEPGDVPALRRIRHDSGAALAVVLDVEQWAARVSAPDLPAPSSGVTRLGWRATTLGPRDRLEEAWRDLGRSGGRAAVAGGAVSR